MSRHPGKIVSNTRYARFKKVTVMEVADVTDRDATGDPEDAI